MVKCVPKIGTCSLLCSIPTYVTNDPRKHPKDYSLMLPMAFSLDFLYWYYETIHLEVYETSRVVSTTLFRHYLSLIKSTVLYYIVLLQYMSMFFSILCLFKLVLSIKVQVKCYHCLCMVNRIHFSDRVSEVQMEEREQNLCWKKCLIHRSHLNSL